MSAMTKSMRKPLAAALGAAFMATLAAPAVHAETNPFMASALSSGYDLGQSNKAGEGKCGEGKCGGNAERKADGEGKCGEGKCGEGSAERKADGEGKCGGKAESKAAGEGKCGEGKCGAM